MEHFQCIMCSMKNIFDYLIVFHTFTGDEFSTMACRTEKCVFVALSEFFSALTNFLCPNQNYLPLVQTQLGLSFTLTHFKCSYVISILEGESI